MASYISYARDRDWFLFESDSSGSVQAELNVPVGQDYDIQLSDESGKLIAYGDNGKGRTERLAFQVHPNRRYYLAIEGVSSSDYSREPYRLRLTNVTENNDIDQVSLESDLDAFKAVQSGDSLFVSVQGRNLGVDTAIYIDVDRDAATGDNIDIWNSSGIDYKIENKTLFKYENRFWTAVNRVSSEGNDGFMEWKAPLALMGIGEGRTIRIGIVQHAGRGSLPIVGQPMFEASASSFFGYESTSSGRSIPSKVDDEILSMSGYFSKNQLVLRVEGQIGEWNDFQIDADYNARTGKNFSEWPSFGADYLVENGGLYASALDGANWNWLQNITAYNQNQDRIDLSIPVDTLDTASDAPIAIAYSNENRSLEPILIVNPENSISRFQVDGKPDEWNAIPVAALGPMIKPTLAGFKDDRLLHVIVEADHLNNDNVFYLNQNFKIEYNQLYRFDYDLKSWTKLKPVYVHLQPTRVEMKVYLSDLGLTPDDQVKVAFSNPRLSIPARGSNMLSINRVLHSEEKGTYYPQESFAVLDNPLMGFVGTGKGLNYNQPIGLISVGISWKELEPIKGKFQWREIEEAYHFDDWSKSGKKVKLRFAMDLPGTTQHRDIPDWLFQELVESEGKASAGKTYSQQGSAGFSPNYDSEVLIQEHARVIAALAERYDHDPRIGFIEIGSLGHYGEFHAGLADNFPRVDVSDRYVQHYIDSFRKKKLGMRKPYPIAADHELGLFNDVFGDRSSTESWLTWTRKGWAAISSTLDSDQSPSAVQENSSMPDFWKSGYSGGEFSSNGSPVGYFESDRFMETLREATSSHTSYLGATALLEIDRESGLTESQQANIDLLLRTIGYRFVVRSIDAEARTSPGSSLELSSHWENIGIAPFYYPWPIAYALADSSGKVVASTIQASTTDIRKWLPGSHEDKLAFRIPEELPDGTYTLMVAIVEPDTGKPGIKLAIEGENADGWFATMKIEVKGSA